MKSPITTHILDTRLGKPAIGVRVTLELLQSAQWRELAHGTTDSDGRVSNFLSSDVRLQPGTYRLTFETAAYFHQQQVPTFYPSISVMFEVADPDMHYHVPLLLSPFGYTTYRGS